MAGLTSPYVLIGLGNPGNEYHNSRHNVGYCVLDAFADLFTPINVEQTKTYTLAKCHVNNNVFYLVKPLTFMNLSGKILPDLKRKIGLKAENIVVIVDNLDLEFNRCRIKENGGNAGHNGLKSISENLGSTNYTKLYIGIGRPQNEQTVSSYVLSRFSKDEEPKFLENCKIVANKLALIPTMPFTNLQKEINT